MAIGSITSRQQPNDSCRKADCGADPKRATPAMVQHDVSNQQRCESCAGTHACEDQTAGDPTFLCRNPASYELIRSREHHGLAGTQQKSNGNKNKNLVADAKGHGRGECGDRSPPKNSCGQHSPRAPSIRQPAGGSLEGCVAQQESAEYPTQLNITEMVVRFQSSAGDS